MFSRYLSLGILAFTAVFSAAPALGYDACEVLGGNQDLLEHGQLFLRTPNGWQPFNSFGSANMAAGTRWHFRYVVRTSPASDRGGLIIIKSNRPKTDEDDPFIGDRVRVVRTAVARDANCPAPSYLKHGRISISTRAYEDYHDYAFRDTPAVRQDERLLRAFHFKYMSDRAHRCLETDSLNYESLTDWTSNRSQFSFDRRVVARGVWTFWDKVFGNPSSPLEGTVRNRTEVRKYKTIDGVACVPFSLAVDRPNFTIKINDLDARLQLPLIGRLSERSWGP